jgi:hypothetical protein
MFFPRTGLPITVRALVNTLLVMVVRLILLTMPWALLLSALTSQNLAFGTVAPDWMNSLMVIAQNSHDLVDPAAPAPSSADVVPLLESLYRELFATILALSAYIFSETHIQNNVQMEAIVVVDRIFVSSAMFKLSVAVLSLHLTVAILYYTD